MPEDAEHASTRTGEQDQSHSKQQSTQVSGKPWFTTPAPIKRLFDKFPLRAYTPNQLPKQRHDIHAERTLYIFTTDEGAQTGRPSFNPSCLKWQVG